MPQAREGAAVVDADAQPAARERARFAGEIHRREVLARRVGEIARQRGGLGGDGALAQGLAARGIDGVDGDGHRQRLGRRRPRAVAGEAVAGEGDALGEGAQRVGAGGAGGNGDALRVQARGLADDGVGELVPERCRGEAAAAEQQH